MEILVHGDNAHRLVGALDGCDACQARMQRERDKYRSYLSGGLLTFATAGALGRKHAMIIVDTIDLVIHVHGEGHAIEAFIANAAAKAARMI